MQGRYIGGNTHQEVMHQRCTTLDERGSSDADLFPSWERLSEEPKGKPIKCCGGEGGWCGVGWALIVAQRDSRVMLSVAKHLDPAR